jgi:hypothetical protein
MVAEQAIEKRVRARTCVAAILAALPSGAGIAISRMCQAALVGLTDFATFFAMARDANIFFFAAITGNFHIFHFADNPAHPFAMRLAATMIAPAIAAIVSRGNRRQGQQQ